jgi:Domain of unknown function (DUF4203)
VLPGSYAVPAAVVLTVGGLLACFAGFRLFRLVLGLYGFLLGALISTSLTGAQDAWTITTAVLVGGVVGAVLMIAAYFVGVGLIGAGLSALALNVGWRVLAGGDPPTLVLVVVAVLGALGALAIAKYVVIVGTSLAGAWSLLIGGLALAGDGSALEAADNGSVWIFYPLDSGVATRWIVPAWVGIAILGVFVQLATSRKGRRAKDRGRRR